ncbi:MAG: succinate dehydrogenase iron-sulfur subunit [Planctomycetota bacterium]|jgi:succinate dehydrogenase / fumarate reductase iron-sulfur subunit
MTAAPASSKTTRRVGEERTVRFRIKRCDGPGKPSRFESFDVTVKWGEGANIISCLQSIASNPRTSDGKDTDPVVWDSGCLEEVCGACTMVINGTVRQSCSFLIDEHCPNDGDTVTLEPMGKFPVVRDLWVDRQRMFHNLARVKAWVPTDGLYALGAGPTESQENQRVRYSLSECMTCGCCLEACPQFTMVEDASKWDTSFVGANAIGQTRLFNMHETGKQLAGDRLDTMKGPGGVSDCGNAQNCVKVCPKHIPLTEAIGAIGRSTTFHAIRSFFTGR